MKIYQQLYHFLPCFIAHSMQGVALFFNSDAFHENSYELGLELGYFLQFMALSYSVSGAI